MKPDYQELLPWIAVRWSVKYSAWMIHRCRESTHCFYEIDTGQAISTGVSVFGTQKAARRWFSKVRGPVVALSKAIFPPKSLASAWLRPVFKARELL